ncbi:uncharacterized protein MONOS_10371 [Monocercomonoides exilis]|uniref:uncharacterized protein n=1 Tax=Monocercomonoides exilis TaxID=2049356 RepID=UPI00355A9E16|nr:hypothetical protein MONOS_10371 [Monocercomonoides exilis]|eukprot:MONOS_10371.1-p1 / transcript=MONOS_10371.1 / gene=MONOS_10371 / organism=Monocercomonoides_exilis_PA203 / gene_product=unspecified product / transcript_product=unspecified product / location=Mono_scaffold00468:37991-38539(+) / protein_length=183 / sequence_SO=supercontig / SO=protein_coding / is_pseudo=false
MHFVSESTGEIEKLSRCIDWKKKAVSIKEKAKIGIIERWYSTICLYTEKCKLSEEESAWLVACTTRLIGLAKDNHRSIVEKCIPIIVACMDENTDIFFSDFLRGRTVDFVLEEMCKFNSDDQSTDKRMIFLSLLTERLNKNVRIARDEKKNKALKMAILDKLEEEGYEDLQISFYGTGHDQN